MSQDLEDKIVSSLVSIMSDGFNRSLRALEDAGAIDATTLRSNYTKGTKFYEIVTTELEMTATYARPGIRKMIEDSQSA